LTPSRVMNTKFRRIPCELVGLLLCLGGCATVESSSYLERHYLLNQEQVKTVGLPLIEWEYGTVRQTQLGKNGDTTISKDGIRKELLYKGTVKGILTLIYREYAIHADIAFLREPFSYEVQYDLSESKMIAFQDFRIKISIANQEEIRYSIVSEPTDFR